MLAKCWIQIPPPPIWIQIYTDIHYGDRTKRTSHWASSCRALKSMFCKSKRVCYLLNTNGLSGPLRLGGVWTIFSAITMSWSFQVKRSLSQCGLGKLRVEAAFLPCTARYLQVVWHPTSWVNRKSEERLSDAKVTRVPAVPAIRFHWERTTDDHLQKKQTEGVP